MLEEHEIGHFHFSSRMCKIHPRIYMEQTVNEMSNLYGAPTCEALTWSPNFQSSL